MKSIGPQSSVRSRDQLGGTGQIFPLQSGVVTETQFLIGLRVLCGLLCICSSSTGGPTRRDRSLIAIARFSDMPRRIAQERVPTASNVGSRDLTWASQPTTLIPFRVFSRIS